MDRRNQITERFLRKLKYPRLIVAVVVITVFAWMVGALYTRWTNFPVEPIFQEVTYSGSRLGMYYLDRERDWRPKDQICDRDGFALIKVEGRYARQPVSHCELIFDAFHRYCRTKSSSDANAVVRLADLLVDEMRPVNLGGKNCVVLFYNFPWMSYKKPWISAMAQGFAMSALCRAYEVQPKPEYIKAAKACMEVFDVDIKDGGVLSHDFQGNAYYEEYAIPERAYKVLNGFIYSLLGLYDLYRSTGDPRAKTLFDAGVQTLANPMVLDRYDVGFWTTYDQSSFRMPSFGYNAVHVRQLTVLYNITGKEIFMKKAEKWRAYNLYKRHRIRSFIWTCWKRFEEAIGCAD